MSRNPFMTPVIREAWVHTEAEPFQLGARVRDRAHRTSEPTHRFQPEDVVIVQRLAKGRKQTEFPFGLPTQVVAVTRTAILTEEAPIWIHASRVKRVPKASSPLTDKEGEEGVKSQNKEGSSEEVCLKSALPQAEDDDPTIFWEICLSADIYKFLCFLASLAYYYMYLSPRGNEFLLRCTK